MQLIETFLQFCSLTPASQIPIAAFSGSGCLVWFGLVYSVMGSLETLSRLETVLKPYFHCLDLGLEGYCLGLGLECRVLVSCLVETFIKTAVT